MKRYIIVAAAVAAVPGAACAQDFTGPRIEARLGYETPTVSDSTGVYKIGSAVSYGGEVGFDAGSKKITFGGYATYEASSVELCDSSVCINEDSTIGAGARIGFVASKNLLIYVKGGYTRIKMSAKLSGLSASDNKDGVQGAIGVETNLGKMAYAKIEFNYGDYGKFYSVNLQRRHVAMGLGLRF